jgi:hypothetical protein
VTSTLSQILGVALLVFLGVGSGVLVWDGLAIGFGARTSDVGVRRRARARLAVGVLGFALAAWLGLGFLTHAR